MSWVVLNAEERASATFDVPPLQKRQECCVGDLCKLLFRGDSLVERMWVRVTIVSRDGYEGTLQNIAASEGLPAHGDKIRFKPQHIIAIRYEG